jgi:hypothetical protein
MEHRGARRYEIDAKSITQAKNIVDCIEGTAVVMEKSELYLDGRMDKI